MSFVLKERICPLLIKLFSPSTKLKIGSSMTQSPQTQIFCPFWFFEGNARKHDCWVV